MTTVSVVIPTYKASAFIRETLASVFAQTRLPDEVIVVDDCSPDDTVAVVEQIAATAPVPVRVIRLEKNTGGPARPLNVGIAAAQGDLIATLDHDDRMVPDRLAVQVAALLASPGIGLIAGQLIGSSSAFGRESIAAMGWEALRTLPAAEIRPGVFRVSSRDAVAGVLRHGCYVLSCSALLFPKAVWSAVGGFDERIRTACDFDLLQAVCMRCDIGYVASVVGEWNSPPSTLHSSAARHQLFGDTWIILSRMAKAGLPAVLKPLWRRVVRDFLFDSGYAFRKSGHLRDAAACQVRSVQTTGVSGRVVKELTKIGMATLFPFSRGAAT